MNNYRSLTLEHKCPICGSRDTIIDASTGETICRECGYVHTDKTLDMGPDWRAFNHQEREDRARAGAPLT
ncbi:MAG: TFIIB-type zinc ribbon-containing protein, partial [archaeon]